MQYVENEEDINNIEAWAEIIEDMLYFVPFESRMQVLQLAVAKHEANVAEVVEHGPWRPVSAAEMANTDTPGLRHWNAIMRLKSLIIQVFTRNISNNHKSTDAAKLLFAQHRYGTGSRYLGDYIDNLPRS